MWAVGLVGGGGAGHRRAAHVAGELVLPPPRPPVLQGPANHPCDPPPHLQDGCAGGGRLAGPRQRAAQLWLPLQRLHSPLPLLSAGKGKQRAGAAPRGRRRKVRLLLCRLGEEDLLTFREKHSRG